MKRIFWEIIVIATTLLAGILAFYFLTQNFSKTEQNQVFFAKIPKNLNSIMIKIVPKIPIILGRDTLHIDTTSAPQRILLIGDSMAGGLMYRLKDYCVFNNYKMLAVTWISGTTFTFSRTDTLKHFIKRLNATFVILVLGSNELKMYDLQTTRYKYVQKIVQKLDSIPYLWVGPPNWEEDTGINDLILCFAKEKHFFPSKNLTYKRRDHAHPTAESFEMWMDSIASFIVNKSDKPIKLDKPQKRYYKIPECVVLRGAGK